MSDIRCLIHQNRTPRPHGKYLTLLKYFHARVHPHCTTTRQSKDERTRASPNSYTRLNDDRYSISRKGFSIVVKGLSLKLHIPWVPIASSESMCRYFLKESHAIYTVFPIKRHTMFLTHVTELNLESIIRYLVT